MKKRLLFFLLSFVTMISFSQTEFDGLNMGLGYLHRLSDAKTRSISPEDFLGGKGKGGMAALEEGSVRDAARDLGQDWKEVYPFVNIDGGETFVLAEIEGSGAIQHIWMTPTGTRRFSILRIYWDDEMTPSVECPVGDVFANRWGEYAHVSSLPVTVNPGSAYNCYWTIPGEDGVNLRGERESNAPHRNTFEKNIIENNGTRNGGFGFAINSPARDLVLKENSGVTEKNKKGCHLYSIKWCRSQND